MFNRDHLARSGYPADSQGNVCELDTAPDGQLYPFLYFNDIQNPQQDRYSTPHVDTVLSTVLKKESQPNVSGIVASTTTQTTPLTRV